MAQVDVRKGMPSVELSRQEFEKRYRGRFVDPAFQPWYHAPTGLKAMIDRLVCADGGNPDPSSTHGKKPDEWLS
jgi:hypothetical protein